MKRTKLKRNLLVASTAGVLFSLSAAAGAQSTPAPTNNAANSADSSQIAEVTVTARRISENLQTVPVSVTVISAADIAAKGVVNIADVAKLTPNLSLFNASAAKNAVRVSLRGMVQTDNLLSLDPSVGVYVDDIYYARSYSVLTDLLDVSSVEVLKGPQGTLYGRNTIGGAVKVTTIKADPNGGYTGKVTLGAGNFGSTVLSGAINLPLVPGTFAVRIAASQHKDDGYTKSYLLPVNVPSGVATSLSPIKTINTDNNDAVSYRVSARWTPADAITVDVTTARFKADDNGQANVDFNGDIVNGIATTTAPWTSSAQHRSDFYSVVTDSLPYTHTKVDATNAAMVWKMSDSLTSKLIVGYVYATNDTAGNSDGTVNTGLSLTQFMPTLLQKAAQTTGEYQLLGQALDSRLNYLLGAYYFKEKGSEGSSDATQRSTTYVFSGDRSSSFTTESNNKSASAFANADYSWTDQLRSHLGLRYTKDTKSLVAHPRQNGVAPPAGSNGVLPGVCVLPAGVPGIITSTTNGGPCQSSKSNDYTNTTWEVGGDYKMTDDHFLYAKVGNGFRSGGQQGRAVGGQSLVEFQPDKVLNYEVGIKSEFMNRHVRLNLSVFHTKFSNTQQTLILAPPAVPTTTTVVVNQGEAKVDGFEVDTVMRLGEQFTLTGGAGYSKFKYANANVLQPASPKWTGQLGGSYVQPTGLGDVTGRLDYSYRGDYFITGGASPTVPGNISPSVGLLSGRLSLALRNGLDLAIWGKNLGDKQYLQANLIVAYTPGFFYGDHAANFGAPRTFGFEASYKF